MQTDSERFWSKVNKTETCWLWPTNEEQENTYANFRIQGKVVKAHRWAWEQINGPIPKGKKLDHKCHNRRCVFPEHLRVVTNKQNLENRKPVEGRVRGVSRCPYSDRWIAKVVHNYKVYRLGSFQNKEEAEKIVIAKRNELFTHNDEDRR